MNHKYPYDPKFQEFADFLGLPSAKDATGVYWRGNDNVAKKIEELYVWGKEKSKSEDMVDVMLAVRSLARDLGVNYKGKLLVDHLWGFTQLDTKNAKLDSEKLRVEKDMELYKNPLPPSVEEEKAVEEQK